MPSYCLLADLKTYLNISATADDDLLQSLLDTATNRIDTFCTRNFQAAASGASKQGETPAPLTVY